MNKVKFLTELDTRLSGLDDADKKSRMDFYAEMIDDRIEEGKTEEQAIEELGGVDKVVREIAEEIPLTRLIRKNVKPKKKLNGWHIALIVIGFPVWLPLIVTAITLMFVAMLLTWVFVLVSYSVEAGIAATGVYSVIVFFYYLFGGNAFIFFLGAAAMAMGISILFWFACKKLTALTVKINKSILTGVKTILIGRRTAK